MDWAQELMAVGKIAGSYLLALPVGWYREKEAHSAGLRTFPIVGMASCGYLLVLGPQPDGAAQSRVVARADHRHWLRGRRRNP